MSDRTPKNKYRVNRKAWSKWTVVGKHVFNKTFETMMGDKELFLHPETVKRAIPDKEWKTTAWNAAFIAADIATRGERHLLETLVREIKGDSENGKATVR